MEVLQKHYAWCYVLHDRNTHSASAYNELERSVIYILVLERERERERQTDEMPTTEMTETKGMKMESKKDQSETSWIKISEKQTRWGTFV